jgi:hypothetical protein
LQGRSTLAYRANSHVKKKIECLILAGFSSLV